MISMMYYYFWFHKSHISLVKFLVKVWQAKHAGLIFRAARSPITPGLPLLDSKKKPGLPLLFNVPMI